jgi:large subunit ribosomal protein L29|tara:strand:+ start:6343 stop:6558 length:216 start_codon:yes stop_codon:yes gene_type:complete
MTLPKYSELGSLLTESEIDQEIFILQKSLFDLRIKRSTNQASKPHLFKHAKRRIAQLKFKRSQILQTPASS